MALPKIMQMLFGNGGAGPKLRDDILPIATTTTIGGIKLGDGFGVDQDGKPSHDFVRHSAQTLTDGQKQTARENIGIDNADWNAKTGVSMIKNKPVVISSIDGVCPSSDGILYTDSDENPLYLRPSLMKAAKRSVTVPAGTIVKIGGVVYKSTTAQTLSITDFGNLQGKNVYVYACAPTSGTEPVFVVSQNSTVPSGYTATNSRKIGGFQTNCMNVGTISGHTLSGYVIGDILPASVWDLFHRPKGSPEGYSYIEYNDSWVSNYLLSWDGSNLVSVYGGAIADGYSSKKWHGELFREVLYKQKQRLPSRDEFLVFAEGSNEATNISGSNDKGTTGGWTDTKGRAMVSNHGIYDCCGFMWQWLSNLGFAGGSSFTESVYNSSVDSMSKGQTYGNLYRLLAGGDWSNGASCGSRSAACNYVSSHVAANIGGRGASEPLHRNALNDIRYPF